MPLDDGTPLPPTLPARPRVLVVDDEPAVRMVSRLMLEGAGYAVTEVGDAAAAVERVAKTDRPFMVVLLDVTLPDRSGTELLAELRYSTPRSRVVLTSGKPEEDVPDHGADSYLPKPFTRDQLLAAVRSATAMTTT
ncbi:response regulator [Frigoriglobus tundricola]|uniref:Phosphate regulon transcriptional regulatory protein PhoB (SphR) n=1 Tax=Frigoriglobus tundricola TaxID=2774151 RepID=A0A6M5YMP9_9BACT|nr:response regulator [Frigoriglobus tundricola]QJW94212.1 Phosphate regulon transcriptional regulatory protein PhoB (SphR) [Frigoriglobus tundricola]